LIVGDDDIAGGPDPDPSLMQGIRGDVRIIGEQEFVAGFRDQAEQAHRTEVPSRERLIARPSLADLFSNVTSLSERNDRIREARRTHRYRIVDIARAAGLHYSTVSEIAKLAASTGADLPQGVTAVAFKR
jgi:hypothetical protein